MRYALPAMAISILISGATWAGKPLPQAEKRIVGEGQPVKVEFSMDRARRLADGYQWHERIAVPGASFLKAHFTNVSLRDGDRIVLVNALGRVVEEITGRGPKDRSTFWALSAQGDSLVVRFEFSEPYASAPFRLDRIIAGERGLFQPGVESGERSICSPADFEDAICYQGDAGKWSNVRASVGVMSVGGNANSALFCSGSNISPTNRLLTNQHCIETQGACDNSEFVFEFYRTECGTGAPTSGWQSFRCDEVLEQEPFINCDAGAGDLDFTLASVLGDPAATFGHVSVDPAPLASGEGIYIVQHPNGRPHELTLGDGASVVVDGSVLRYYDTLDTEGGSSGSPIFRSADNKLVGLHHCGGCSSPGVGNRGMLMSDIYPLISEHLCTPQSNLLVDSAGDLSEVSGNGNTTIDPGEQWSFTLSVTNNACDLGATGVSAQLSVAGGAAVLDNPTIEFGTIAAGASATSAPITFTLPTDAPCGDVSIFDVDALADSDDGVFAGTAGVFDIMTGARQHTIVFSEAFDQGLANWTLDDGGTGSGTASTWTTGNPGARSLTLTAPYSIVDSDQLGNGQSMDDAMISPVIDARGFDTLTLQFTHDFNHYASGEDEQADVEVRSFATLGQWVLLRNFSGGDSSGTVTIDVTAYAAADMQLRFHYYNAVYEWWWAVDDIMVIGELPGVCNVFGSDADGDGVADASDNCQLVANGDQRDSNGDGYGNACDADLNNDGIVNTQDLGLLKSVFFTADADADFNGDGVVNTQDLGILKNAFFGAPGPSGTAP